ncbi:MAG: hypothetical protein GQ529_01245 [Methyloprofundus sp.]|nr:hypothetical protein [Methyloprofundus sp.]
MSKLDQERENFIENLHEIFLINKGYGAFAYITLADAINLFDQFLKSNESADVFIRRFVKSV